MRACHPLAHAPLSSAEESGLTTTHPKQSSRHCSAAPRSFDMDGLMIDSVSATRSRLPATTQQVDAALGNSAAPSTQCDDH